MTKKRTHVDDARAAPLMAERPGWARLIAVSCRRITLSLLIGEGWTRSPAVHRSISMFSDSYPDEHEHAEGSEGDKLDAVPHAQQDEHVQPARTAIANQNAQRNGSEKEGGPEHHERHTPLETVPGSKPTKEHVGWRIVKESAEADRQPHGESKHGGVLSD
jgi:hypothetical protein